MIIRVEKREAPYVTIDKKPINQKSLSYRAKGILAYLMSKPADWEIQESDIIKHGTEGRDAVRTAIKELIAHRYMVKDQKRSEKGLFEEVEWMVSDQPFTENPLTDYPLTDYPIHTNNKSTNNNNTKIKETLSLKDQATNQFAKCYYPMLNCYEMWDAKERLELFLNEDQNMNYVIQAAMTKKSPKEVKAYVNKFVGLSWDTKYKKFIRSFPELLKRFISWLSRDREQASVSPVDLGSLYKEAVNQQKESPQNEKYIESIESIDIIKMKENFETRVASSPTLSKMTGLKDEDYVYIALNFYYKVSKRTYLKEILLKIESDEWLQKHSRLFDAILKSAK